MLKAEIEGVQQGWPINKLCIFENDKVKYLSMLSALPLDDILQNFDIMFRKYSITLFHVIWKNHMVAASKEAIKGSSPLVIKDIKLRIWDPTFNECVDLLRSLEDRSITLTDVDRHFKQYQEKEMLLRHLHDGVTECLDGLQRPKSVVKWIPTVLHLMNEYWSLVNLADTAKTLMKMKKELALTGDFSLIETIANKVAIKLYVIA